MQITLEDLNPRVARSVEEKVRVLLQDPAEEEGSALTDAEREARRVLTEAEQRAQAGSRTGPLFPLLASLLLVGGYASFYFESNVFEVALPTALTSVGFMTVCRMVWMGREGRPAAVRSLAYPPEVWGAVLPLILRSPAGGVYKDSVLLLADRQMPLDAPTGREILRQLNLLLDNRFLIDTHRRQVVALLEAVSVARLEAEREELERKVEQAEDALAWETLRDSVELCERRLEHARALRPMLERLDAQQEIIYQALASVHSALVRLQAASLTLAALSVTGIKETVQRIDRQTRAVEQAVEEVMALRAGL